MALRNVLQVNHRELVLSRRRKARYGFLLLPATLQDLIIDSMDRGQMTLIEAQDFITDKGFRLSRQAISTYYQVVRNGRAELLRGAHPTHSGRNKRHSV
jgi:hypothetical protein